MEFRQSRGERKKLVGQQIIFYWNLAWLWIVDLVVQVSLEWNRPALNIVTIAAAFQMVKRANFYLLVLMGHFVLDIIDSRASNLVHFWT